MERDWWVYSTVIDGRLICVKCRNTGIRGTIADFTEDEWRRAFEAPSNPYRWDDANRVVEDA